MRATMRDPATLGLGANWRQFALLVAVNAFVGSMVGVERSVLRGKHKEAGEAPTELSAPVPGLRGRWSDALRREWSTTSMMD